MSFAESYITNDITIKGLDKYYEASNNGFNAAAWENVGIKTYYQDGKAYIEFELNKEVNVFDAMYFLYENAYSPVPESFIQQLGNGNFDEGVKIWGNMSNDGLTPVDTWLSTGPYTIERWDMNQQIVLKKNPYYNLAGDWKYQIEGIHISILGAASNDYYAAIKEFNNGKLHEIKINSQIANEYKNDPRALIIPTGSTMKLNFNSCTQEEWESLFGVNGTVMQTELYNYWECKPIMSNDDFLKGISYSINRVEYADRFFGIPSNSYFGSNFVADPLSGIMYNDTDYHREAIKELSDGTEYGYNYQYAVSSFKKAAETLIADGYYTYGDVIEVEIAWQTPENKENHSYIKKYIEDAWNAADTGLQLNIVFWCGAVWSDVYYNKMMCGQYDIGFGSVSGSTINITGNFEMFKSDNSSGFTLNWGCDTNEVSADIYYDGMYWSFDALYEAATVGGYFENGKAVH
jgi:ABC-type transport system substrate-binding protein